MLPAGFAVAVSHRPLPAYPRPGLLGSQSGCWMVYAPALAVSNRIAGRLRWLWRRMGVTGPPGPLKVATSLLRVAPAPGAAPPDQLAPVSHKPSPPPPVHVWLAAR